MLQAAAAVRVISTASQEGSGSTTSVSRWFLMSRFAYTTHFAVYFPAQSSPVGTLLRTVQEKEPKKLVVDTKAATAAARPRSYSSSSGSSRFLLSSFWLHRAHYVCYGAKVSLPAFVTYNKLVETLKNFK